MSRKTIGFVVSIITVILTALQKQFGLSLDPGAVALGLGSILTYIFFEAKLDMLKLKQPGRWTDPKFLITFISTVLAAIEAQFNLGIPVEVIIPVLTAIVGVLFGKKLLSPGKPY